MVLEKALLWFFIFALALLTATLGVQLSERYGRLGQLIQTQGAPSESVK